MESLSKYKNAFWGTSLKKVNNFSNSYKQLKFRQKPNRTFFHRFLHPTIPKGYNKIH